ncbi:MAG TPA: Sir2 family NAD-dependent protein deacetylase [Kofleriaceae bacterium]|nr:Sir2 family NAD-dependent protein deacetylase [Kofleriaceae bacterium]
MRWNPADGSIVALTGAGISAESGIPTFRGKEGYWAVGSTVYHPQELATSRAFRRTPDIVWQWYLYRRTVCRAAGPNPAHRAIVSLEQRAGDGFRLLTQNVDGLHLRAGNTLPRTYQIHGNIDYMRCVRACTAKQHPVPDAVGDIAREDPFTEAHRSLLVCPECAAPTRPHVLWFDEYYDEDNYRFQSSLAAAANAAVLIIVGSTAQTNLPVQVAQAAARAGATIIDINIDDNPFAELARASGGRSLRGKAGALLPALVDELLS